jgi:hypothetical protein
MLNLEYWLFLISLFLIPYFLFFVSCSALHIYSWHKLSSSFLSQTESRSYQPPVASRQPPVASRQ